MTDTPAPAEKPILGHFTGLVKSEGGFKGAAKAGFGDIKKIISKEATWGQRGVGFGRVIGVGAGLSIAKGAFESQTVDGEDRSALARLGQAVLGTGIAAGSLVVGKGR